MPRPATGAVQESLSLSHAVTLALSCLFQQRLAHVAASAGTAARSDRGPAAEAYSVRSIEQLAPGWTAGVGVER